MKAMLGVLHSLMETSRLGGGRREERHSVGQSVACFLRRPTRVSCNLDAEKPRPFLLPERYDEGVLAGWGHREVSQVGFECSLSSP